MTNEQRASELSAMYETSFTQDASYFSAMRMAEWKDEQFEKEKQQWIEKVCEWLTNNISKETFIISDGNVSVNFKGVIEAFKKVMEE